MTIGLRIGPAIGPRIGLAVGLNQDPLGGGGGGAIVGVTRDSMSGKYAPANAAEWALLLAAAGLATGGPGNVWPCQDASGAIANTVGASSLTVTPVAPVYQSGSTGWARFGLRTIEGTASQRMFQNSGVPDPSATSTLVLGYIEMPGSAPAAERGLITKTATGTRVSLNTTGKLRLTDGGAADLANSILGGVRLVWYLTDLTATKSAVYTEAEEFIGTFAAPAAGSFIGFAGTVPATAASYNFLYLAEFAGTSAQLTKAQIRTLSQTLGWTVAF